MVHHRNMNIISLPTFETSRAAANCNDHAPITFNTHAQFGWTSLNKVLADPSAEPVCAGTQIPGECHYSDIPAVSTFVFQVHSLNSEWQACGDRLTEATTARHHWLSEKNLWLTTTYEKKLCSELYCVAISIQRAVPVSFLRLSVDHDS